MIIKQLFIFIILNSFMVTALKSMEDDYKFDRPYIFYREQCNDVEVTLFNNKTKEEREADRTVDQAHKMEKELKELKNWRACLCSKREYFITQKEFKDLLDQDWFLKNSSLQGAFFDKEFLASIAGGGRLADLDTNSTLNCILSHAHIDKLNKERMVRAALFNNELENFNALLTFDPSLIKEANKYRPLYQ